MKKIAFAVILLMAITTVYAQEGNNICVWNALKTKEEGGVNDDLEKATKCSDEAIANDATSGKSKTWFYRGQLYRTIFQDSVLKMKYGTAAFEAINAFKKVYDLADPKFKDWDDIYTNLYVLGTLTFNEGVDQYHKNNFAQAFQYFYAIKDINGILDGKKKNTTIDLGASLKNAANAAENAGNKPDAYKAYKAWIAVAPNEIAYQRYAQSLKAGHDTAESKKIVDEGLSKYPKNSILLADKVNFFLDEKKYTDALGYINNLLEVDPKNDQAIFVEASTFYSLGKIDSAVYYYNRVIQVNDSNFDAYSDLAAVYFNQGNEVNNEMNKLGNTPDDTKKYNVLKEKRKELYLKAKPYIDRAHQLKPNDDQTNRIVRQIESYTSDK